jgi:hypothetical protein
VVVRLARIERNLSEVQCRAASGKVAHRGCNVGDRQADEWMRDADEQGIVSA